MSLIRLQRVLEFQRARIFPECLLSAWRLHTLAGLLKKKLNSNIPIGLGKEHKPLMQVSIKAEGGMKGVPDRRRQASSKRMYKALFTIL